MTSPEKTADQQKHTPSPVIKQPKISKDYLHDRSLIAPTPLFELWYQWHMATALIPQPFMSMLSAITTFGVCIGSGYRSWTGLKANPYVVALAPTGAGKENPRQMSLHLLSACGMGESIGASSWGSDSGFEREISSGDMLWNMDEFSMILKDWQNPHCPSYKIGIKKMLLETHNGAKYYGRSLKDANEQRIIEDPMPIIYATSQPSMFFAALTTELVSQGFVNRTMVFDAARVERVAYRSGTKDAKDSVKLVPEACPKGLVDYIVAARKLEGDMSRETLNMKRKICRFYLSHAADERMKQIHEALQDKKMTASEVNDVHGAALTARVVEKISRLAIIHAWSKSASNMEVGVDSIEWANRMVEIAERTIAIECPTLKQTGSDYESDFNAVLAKIVAAGPKGIGHAVLMRTRRMPRQRFQDILMTLQTSGQVEITQLNGGMRIRVLDTTD